MTALGIVLANYLLGAIPFGLIISKWAKGIDPRRAGSGNIGATNVLRVVSKQAAALTLVCDLIKGIPLLLVARWMALGETATLFVGFAAVLGHVFPVFLRFKGGKGVATSFGVILVLAPPIALTGLVLWGGGVFFGKYASVGALTAFGALPFLTVLFNATPNFVIFSTAISSLIYLRHWTNIRRLVRGTEGDV